MANGDLDYITEDPDTTKIIRFMPEFLRDGPNLKDLTLSVAQEIEIVLNFNDKAKSQIQVSTATGSCLDDIALTLKLKREPSESDEVFRARIVSHVNATTSSGTEGDLKKAIANYAGIGEDGITITYIAPGVIEVSAYIGEDIELANTVTNVIEDAKSAGVYAFTDINTDLPIDNINIDDTVAELDTPAGRFYGVFTYGGPLSSY
jgi:hypothetical protein